MLPWKANLPLDSKISSSKRSNMPDAGWWREQMTILPRVATSLKIFVTANAAKLSNPVVGSSQNNMLGSVKS